ncbi:hypothetical protein PGTUg99_036006 [Puccinia graminis f. sp. tritici]|uniref:Uncharacterized protein n=1 Tax=Puccinia graminis f. sp. tritici TaxID=56615 RepID=A0A5B0RP17_PUCGR|nr:hypothetical protein PGTUg99_036006 [Puccinia graminis f. sp. tritici]
MSPNATTESSRVLCPETQSPQGALPASTTVIVKSPRVAAIELDYVLYIEVMKHTQLSRRHGLPPIKWEKLVPSSRPAPMEANIVSFTWPRFQTEAINHLANHFEPLRAFLFKNNDAGNLVWLAYIKDHRDYGLAVTITGATDFLRFSDAAYDAFPARVTFKITMDDPTRLAYEESMRAYFQHHRRIADAIKSIKAHATVTSLTNLTVVHPENPQLVMDVLTKDLIDWAEALVAHQTDVTPQMPPQTAKFVWVDGRKRPTPHALGAPPSKRNTGPDFTTPPNRTMATPSGMSPSDEDDIEVIPISSGAASTSIPTPGATSTSIPAEPVTPASPELESHSMETYLHVAHIHQDDKLTRARLLNHGIVHWSFFRSSTEIELIGLGFPIGIARLLIEGAARLARYDHTMEVYTGGMTPSPSPLV